jgi:hypothetical protein
LLVVFWLILSNFALADEPRRAIDDTGVRIFIESQRPEHAGLGKVVAAAGGYFDSDSFPDKLVVYSYENTTASRDQAHGLYAVAFFTENFDTSDILFIPATEVFPESVREYSSDGSELVITGKRHLPDDDGCCPSSSASIALWVVDGNVVILKREDSQSSSRN